MSDDSGFWLLVVGLVGVIVLYWVLYCYYCNIDKLYFFEYEIVIEVKLVIGLDQQVGWVIGIEEKCIRGDNVYEYWKWVVWVKFEEQSEVMFGLVVGCVGCWLVCFWFLGVKEELVSGWYDLLVNNVDFWYVCFWVCFYVVFCFIGLIFVWFILLRIL